MDRTPGHHSRRPEEAHSFSFSTPDMEMEAYDMRCTHLTITMPEQRRDITPTTIADALVRKLKCPWDDVHVSASFPEDFLIRFNNQAQCDLAINLRHITLRGVKLDLMPWSSTARGYPRTWRHYFRVAIVNLPKNAWNW